MKYRPRAYRSPCYRITLADRGPCAESPAANRVPTTGKRRSGGLFSYGACLNDQFRQAAFYVDRILKGANPAELPVQTPTKYLLIVNRTAAKSLEIAVPASVLARADEVIE